VWRLTSFTLDQQKTLQTYVNSNGHGLSRWAASPAKRWAATPTRYSRHAARPGKPPKARRRQIALLLIIDRSASMAIETPGEGVSKILWRRNRDLAAGTLNPKTRIGVLAFDKNPTGSCGRRDRTNWPTEH